MLRAMVRPRILLIDDSETVLLVVHAALAEHFDVETATDGVTGLERARQSRPDLVVTDSLMPGLDGLGLVRALKGAPETSAIPVIVLTSEDLPELSLPANDVRPAAVVAKAMDMSPLIDAIHAALRRTS
jgi:CheY-like chemotaxis protein